MIKLNALRPRFEMVLNEDCHNERRPIVERIGRGRFTTAYREIDTPTVYLFASETGDSSKRILMDCAGPYIPALKLLGDRGDSTVFETTFYPRLTAKSVGAWAQYRLIAKCREAAWSEVVMKRDRHTCPLSELGYDVMSRTVDAVQPQNEELAEALQQVADSACNYGQSYVFEFAPRNLATDDAGHLILLDPVFDLRFLEEEQRNAEKRRRTA